MPDVTLTNFADGVAAPSSTLNANIYTVHATAPASLEVVNGWLDGDNLPSGRQIERRHVQPNAFVVGGEVGSNAPLDFFDDVFDTTLAANGYTTGDTEEDFIPIPGACASFYCPWAAADCLVIVTWNISWLCDGDAAGDVGVIRFGHRTDAETGYTWTNALRRVVPSTVRTEGADVFFRGTRQQHWAGHALLTSVGKGWHHLGLFVGSTALQTRVWNRSMRYIVIRRT